MHISFLRTIRSFFSEDVLIFVTISFTDKLHEIRDNEGCPSDFNEGKNKFQAESEEQGCDQERMGASSNNQKKSDLIN